MSTVVVYLLFQLTWSCVPSGKFVYPVFASMPGESYFRQFGFLCCVGVASFEHCWPLRLLIFSCSLWIWLPANTCLKEMIDFFQRWCFFFFFFVKKKLLQASKMVVLQNNDAQCELRCCFQSIFLSGCKQKKLQTSSLVSFQHTAERAVLNIVSGVCVCVDLWN